MMDQERFEELLLAEIDGRLTLDQRAQLDAACEHDSGLSRLRKNDLRVARMMRTIPPARVPVSLAADVMHRFEQELAGEPETEQYETPAPRSRAAYDEDPFETTSSGSRYREVYEPYREQVAVRSTAPWWSMILGSTFMRLSFGMSVMILCVYMGSVIMKQSRSGGTPKISGMTASNFPEIGEGASDPDGSKVVALATAEPVPHVTEARVSPLENPNPTAIDLNALAELTPLPAVEEPLQDDMLADAKTEAESVGRMDPAIEKMLGNAEGSDAAAQSATAAAIAAIPTTGSDAASQPTSAITTQPAMQSAPVVIASSNKPQVDLPEGMTDEPEARPSVDEKAIASADTKPQAGAGMEEVFERIKDDLEPASTERTSSTPPGAREVKDVKELRTALSEREVASAPSASVPSSAMTAPVSSPQPSQTSTRVVTEVDELRDALSGRTKTTTTKPVSTKSLTAAPDARPSAAPAVSAPTPSTSPAPKMTASAPASEKIQNGFATSSAPTTTSQAAPSSAPKMSPEERLRKIEMAIVRNGGTILARKADDKDPTTTRVKVLMTRAQIRSLEHDLAKQGLAPAKKREESAAEVAVGEKPIEFEILVKAR